MTDFIGLGEDVVYSILTRLFSSMKVERQYPISKIISKDDYDFLDEVYQKHKFDFAVIHQKENLDIIFLIVEVNYRHKVTATKKETNIFGPLLKKYGIQFVKINDYECDSIFKKNKTSITNDDFIDFFNALKICGVKLI